MSKYTRAWKAKKYSPPSRVNNVRKSSKGPRSKSILKKSKFKISEAQSEKLSLTAIQEVVKIDKRVDDIQKSTTGKFKEIYKNIQLAE